MLCHLEPSMSLYHRKTERNLSVTVGDGQKNCSVNVTIRIQHLLTSVIACKSFYETGQCAFILLLLCNEAFLLVGVGKEVKSQSFWVAKKDISCKIVKRDNSNLTCCLGKIISRNKCSLGVFTLIDFITAFRHKFSNVGTENFQYTTDKKYPPSPELLTRRPYNWSDLWLNFVFIITSVNESMGSQPNSWHLK